MQLNNRNLDSIPHSRNHFLHLIVAKNIRGISKGIQTLAQIEEIHELNHNSSARGNLSVHHSGFLRHLFTCLHRYTYPLERSLIYRFKSRKICTTKTTKFSKPGETHIITNKHKVVAATTRKKRLFKINEIKLGQFLVQ